MTNPSPTPRSGTITAIETQQKRQHRVNIFLDGEFALGIHRDVALDAGLKVGDPIDEATFSKLHAKEQARAATEVAIRALTSRPRSEREIRDRLRQKGFEPPVVDQVVRQLQEWRYLDDADFARYWIENRDNNRPRGKRLLEQELRLKGVDRETIAEAFGEEERDELAAAMAVAERKASAMRSLPAEVRQQRLMGYLARRGFDYDTIKQVVKRLGAEDTLDETSDEGM